MLKVGRLSALCIAALALLSSAAVAGTLAPVPTVIGSPPPELMPTSVMDGPSPDSLMSATTLAGVPAAMWYYGCSATSAGMLFGYYDKNGFSNMFAGEIDDRIDSASELGLIATPQHVAAYWQSYGSAGPDPWEAGGVEHTWAGCTADFLGTNQWKWDWNGGGADFNRDGETTYWSLRTGAPLYDYIPPASYGLPQTELGHGLRLFAESRGYTVAYRDGNYQVYNQGVDSLFPGVGFSFTQFMAEIDAGRPVLIHVTNHTMLGYGYNAATREVVLYDTWNYGSSTMVWGSYYSGLMHEAVTVLELGPTPHSASAPEPGSVALFGAGILALALVVRRRRVVVD